MNTATLFSGSTGNCTLMYNEHTAFLIDAGKSCRKINEALFYFGMSLSDIDAVFVTHEHNDHISALETVSKRYHIPIHITGASLAFLGFEALRCAVEHPVFYEEKLSGVTVRSCRLSHDSACHVGYRVTEKDGDDACVATDTGYVSSEALSFFTGCRAAVIESNHDTEMLKHGPYPYYLKTRIMSKCGHLSNDDSAEFCRTLCEGGCESIILAHLSRENNTPELACETVSKSLGDAVCSVCAASPDEVTALCLK